MKAELKQVGYKGVEGFLEQLTTDLLLYVDCA
jgi:hypothetical protein